MPRYPKREGLDPVVSIRIPQNVLDAIDAKVARQKKRGFWGARKACRTSWILEAIGMRMKKR